MFVLESVLCVPITIGMLCLTLIVSPGVYADVREMARTETLSVLAAERSDHLYRISVQSFGESRTVLLETSPQKALLLLTQTRDLIRMGKRMLTDQEMDP